jgi:hypothetical protein
MDAYRNLSESNAEKPAVLIEFYSVAEKDEAATAAAGHAVFRDVEWARWYKRGSNGQSTECPVARLPKYYPAIWNAFQDHYRAWKAGQEPPLNGTPLAEWPQASRAEVETLRSIHIRTVEELAELTDADGQRLGNLLGWRALRDKARAWKMSAEDRGRTAALLAAKDAEIEALRAALEEMRKDVDVLKASLDRLAPRAAPPPRAARQPI